MVTSRLFPHLRSVLFLDQPQKFESLLRAGILSYPCQLEFCSGSKNEAARRIQNDPPALLVTALQMEGGTSLDLLQELRRKNAAIPTIFIAEQSQTDLRQEILRAGAFDLLFRPFEMPDLIRKIDGAIRISSRLQQKTRIEAFLEYGKLQEESATRGLLVSELLEQADPQPQ